MGGRCRTAFFANFKLALIRFSKMLLMEPDKGIEETWLYISRANICLIVTFRRIGKTGRATTAGNEKFVRLIITNSGN